MGEKKENVEGPLSDSAPETPSAWWQFLEIQRA